MPGSKVVRDKGYTIGIPRGYIQSFWANAGIVRRIRAWITNRLLIQRYAVGNIESVVQ